MQRWEYCLVYGQGEAEILFYDSDGGHRRKLKPGEEHIKAIAELGEAGWEMVTSTSLGVYFKRPKQ